MLYFSIKREYDGTCKEAKIRAKTPEENKAIFKRWHANEQGEVWVALGNTYGMKDQLKAMGAHYEPVFGWYFDHAVEDIPLRKLETEEVWRVINDYGKISLREDVFETVKQYRKEYVASLSPVTYFFGEVGDKIEKAVVLTKVTSWDSVYGTCFFYRFIDTEGHVFVWKTGSVLDLEAGKSLILKGTIKEHKEYEGTKETVLTRCKIA